MANGELDFRMSNYVGCFSTGLSESLKRNEFVDMTLAADGHFFGAHRLILSSVSPYFRQMFRQMPANQHTCVFLKDISHQTIADLITYIYCGEVSVKVEHFKQFIATAKALQIKGFDAAKYPTISQPDKSSTSSIQIDHSTYIQQTKLSNVIKRVKRLSDVSCSKSKTVDSSNKTLTNSDNDADSSDVEIVDPPKKKRLTQYSKQSAIDVAQLVKSEDLLNIPGDNEDDYGYNIMADIRKNAKGIENLYHGGHKYYKYGDQNWRCTKMSKCKAKVRTAVINGVTMMKFLEPEHSHTI